MSLTYPPNGTAAQRDAGGAPEVVHVSRLNNPDITERRPEAQYLLADMRAEHRRLRFALLSVECIGVALSRGVLDTETAMDMYATRPRLRYEPDEWAADFLARVMADDPPRRTYRRAA